MEASGAIEKRRRYLFFESGEFKDDRRINTFKFWTLNGAPLIAFVFVFCDCVLYHDSCWRINLKLDIEHTLSSCFRTVGAAALARAKKIAR